MDWSDGVDVYANATAMHVGRFFGSTDLLPMEVDSLGLFKASQLILVFLRLWRQSIANQLRTIYAEEKDQEHEP